MHSRKLGKTGLLASEASFGTAEIGIDYDADGCQDGEDEDDDGDGVSELNGDDECLSLIHI